MPLKFKLKSRDEAPAELQALYVEREGAWVLDVEGAVDRVKLEEFRQNNIALRREVDDARAMWAGFDPSEVRALLADKAKLEEAQRLKEGGIDAVVTGRLKTAQAEWQKQLSAITAERDTLTRSLAEIRIDQAVVTEATKRGLRPTALEDLTGRARKIFALVDGVPRALEADGKTVKAGRDGVTPLAVPEWVEGLVTAAPHLFEGNAGSGAVGSGSGGAGGNGSGKNPFRKESWNLTEQMRLMKTDPPTAARLKAAA